MFVSKIEGLVLHKKKITQLNTSLYCLKCRKSALESFESEIDTEQEKKKQKKLRIFREALLFKAPYISEAFGFVNTDTKEHNLGAVC